jgi:hypothetical protein
MCWSRTALFMLLMGEYSASDVWDGEMLTVSNSVLIPDNLSGATPSASGTATGTAAATGTATVVPGMGSTMGKGAIGVAALFGGAAALMNM